SYGRTGDRYPGRNGRGTRTAKTVQTVRQDRRRYDREGWRRCAKAGGRARPVRELCNALFRRRSAVCRKPGGGVSRRRIGDQRRGKGETTSLRQEVLDNPACFGSAHTRQLPPAQSSDLSRRRNAELLRDF